MSLKLRRNHFSGISNLDFRTKGDLERIKFYQPYHESKKFGIQGLSNFKLPPSVHKKLFAPTKGINEGKFEENEMPNPQNYESALFYRNNSMKIKPKVFLKVERSKQLDTSEFRGGEEYNGDSMMISETNKKRKEIKLKEKLLRENIKKRFAGDLYGDLSFNKNKEYPSSLSQSAKKSMKKSKSNIIFMDKKIKKERLEMIRNKIFNRLKTHNDTKGIFIKWQNDYLNNRELSIYDLHKIINDLGIPITYNESFALIASANKRNTDKLNYDEFKNFFLNDDNNEKNINIDLSKIPYEKESFFEEKHEKEEENKLNKFNDLFIEKSENYSKIRKLTRNNYPNFLQKLSANTNNNTKLDGTCDLPTFSKIIKTMKIPEKCKNDEIINTLFNKYKIPEKNLMNYEDFIESSKNISEENNFFHFQNGYLGLIQNKLEKNKEERKRYNEILEENARRKNNYLQSQLASMRGHMKSNKSDTTLISKSINFEINKDKKYFLERQSYTDDLKEREKDKGEKEIKEKENYVETEFNPKNKRSFYNHYQPSLQFINHVFKDNKLYFDRYNQSVEEISPLIQSKNNNFNLLKKDFTELEKRKFESLANSKKFNKNFLSNDTEDDKKRFRMFELSKEEKENKIKFLQNSLKRKFETNIKWNDKINFQQQVSDINNSLGQIKRTESLYRYEKKIYDMNNII